MQTGATHAERASALPQAIEKPASSGAFL